MSRRVANFFKKLLGLWRFILIVSAIITIIIVKIFASFQTFMFVLVPILFVVPLILLFSSGICANMKFFAKRFKHLPVDDRPKGPGITVGVSPYAPVSLSSAEIVKAYEKASKLKGTKKEIYLQKIRRNITKIDYDKLKKRDKFKKSR